MRTLIALFAAAMFTTAVADDQMSKDKDTMKSADAKFEKLDRNDDKQLSKTEAQEEDTLAAEFASVDQDADGYVSETEYSARLDTEEPRQGREPY